MARVRLDLPDKFHYSIEIPIRLSDINQGGHLGHDAVLPLIQEARTGFLSQLGFTEANIDGPGIIIADAIIIYKSQAFYGQILNIEVAVCDFTKRGCDFVYRITDKGTGKEVARAKTGIVFYDYVREKIVDVPYKFRAAFYVT